MNRNIVKISKFLSLVLRHDPERIGLVLDIGGWADINELIDRARQAGVPLTRDLLGRVVDENDKQRFAFSNDGQKIRASQGHSLPIDLGLSPVKPPDLLYHGTAQRFLASIRESGIGPGSRHHVHLSADFDAALRVGRRHGKPIVLTIPAARLAASGQDFFVSANGVWLTDFVEPDCIQFPSL